MHDLGGEEVPGCQVRAGDGRRRCRRISSEYYGAGEDSIYLSGIAAGAATKTGTVGYVVPFAIPEVIRHTNAFTLGVQTAHPGAKVKIIWTNSWVDPAKETKAAQNLHAVGRRRARPERRRPGHRPVLREDRLPWVGYDSNAQKFAPKSWLTAAVYNWGPYYLSRVKAAMNGTWKSGFYYGSLKDGFTASRRSARASRRRRSALIASREKAIKNGSWYEFQGPLYDQSGKLRVKKGQRLTVKQLYAMNWLVKGVIGSPKG